MIEGWITVYVNDTPITKVVERVHETDMGFIFLREVTSKKTGNVSESMTHVQCNKVQMKWFIEKRLKDNAGVVPLRLYKGRKK